MLDFIREGLWIPLVFLIAALVYGAWNVHQVLDRFRSRRAFDAGLGDMLVQYRVVQERMLRAAARVDQGDVEQGLEELKEIQGANPGMSAIDYFLGKAYLAKGDKALARAHFEAFLAKSRPFDQLSKERQGEVQGILEGMS